MDPKLKLIFLDMDGTLTTVKSPWQFVHEKLGIWDTLGTDYLNKYLSGEWSYSKFCECDSIAWSDAGKTLMEVKEIIKSIPFPDATREFLRFLISNGIKIAIVSTGFVYTAETIIASVGDTNEFSFLQKDKNSPHFVAANSLIEKNGHILPVLNVCMGEGEGGKREWCRKIMDYYDVSSSECGAVGDSDSDIPMFEIGYLHNSH